MHKLIVLNNSPNEKNVQLASRLIMSGKLLIAPTDTWYGIFADATNAEAVNKIIALKKRRPEHALPLIATSLEQVQRFALLTEAEEKLAKSFWPGPLTIVLKIRQNSSLCAACIERGCLAVRVPDNRFNRAIAAASGSMLTATSTNFSGEEPAAPGEAIRA